MNITNWNNTEEVVVYTIFGALSFSMHLYGLFLTSAIFDFQDEKPNEEKSPFDVLIKDLMRTFVLGSIFYWPHTIYFIFHSPIE